MAANNIKGWLLGSAVLSASMIAVVTQAVAGGFALREQSAYSQGASFAGNATCGESIQGAFWNPAAITCNRGLLTVEGSLAGVFPTSDITTLPGSTFGPGGLINLGDPGDIGEAALVPSAVASYNFNDALFFGLAVNGPFGLATQTNYTHAAQVYGRTSKAFSLNAQPIVGYRVNDLVSVAVGAQIQYFDVRLTQATSPFPGASSAILTGDDTAFGFTAGVMITPTPWTEIGIGYRSRLEHEIEGTAEGVAPFALPISVDLTLPDMATLSVRQRITDRFTLLGTVEWSNWSELGTVAVINGLTGTALTTIPFEYDDGWFFSVGAEYDWSDRLTLRAGVGWEQSPISDEVRTVRLPDDDRLWLSAGLSYDLNENLKLNAGYSYLTTFDTQVNIVAGNPHWVGVDFLADVDADVHIFSAGLKYTFGGEPVLREPVIAKN